MTQPHTKAAKRLLTILDKMSSEFATSENERREMHVKDASALVEIERETLKTSRDRLGFAIHCAKIIGGPWGPPCGVEYGDSNSDNDWACECRSMATHLLDLMDKTP